jgi:hypothetical protein
MPWESEVYEPLAVESLCHLFQDLDAPGVVLDQVIVGGEDGSDLALSGDRRKLKRKSSNIF